MLMSQLISRARVVNPDFDLVKLAGDPVADFETGFNGLDPDAQSGFMQALIRARGANGAVDEAPVRAWATQPGWTSPMETAKRAQLAMSLKAAYAANPGAVEALGKKYMMGGGFDKLREGWGQKGAGGWGNAMTSKGGLGTYLPLGGGLLAMLGGAATNNPWIAMLGLLAAGYGGYKLWNHAKTLQDPELLRTATSDVAPLAAPAPQRPGYATNPAAVTANIQRQRAYQTQVTAQQAARTRLGEAHDAVGPVMGVAAPFMSSAPAAPPKPPAAPGAPTPTPAPAPPLQKTQSDRWLTKVAWGGIGDIPDRGDLATSVKSHIDLFKMKKEIAQDRTLDPAAAGKLLAGIELAERQIDSSQASVGTFGLYAAPVLGLAAGIALGSLFATSPSTQAGLTQVGGGVVSGAQRLGLI